MTGVRNDTGGRKVLQHPKDALMDRTSSCGLEHLDSAFLDRALDRRVMTFASSAAFAACGGLNCFDRLQ